MKTIIVSAVNLRKGGTLTILRNCLEYLSQLAQNGEYKVVALVHNKNLAMYPGITYIEMPWTVKSWFCRIWCEYITMYKISKQLSPVYLWLSLHDTTPNVKAERRVVYCHNSFPFYPWKWRELFMNYRIVCFAWLTEYIYRINIHKNYKIVVQQDWMKREFIKLFNLHKDKIIVALPENRTDTVEMRNNRKSSEPIYTFIYPSYGDINKNFELLCEAAAMLENEIGEDKFKVYMTISGTENKYTRWLYRKWGHVNSLVFTGFLDRVKLYELYGNADCLIFPSKVETWGLPISEFAQFERPMLLADLPYAHETAAGSAKTSFFNIHDANILKGKMKKLIDNDNSFLEPISKYEPEAPVSHTWEELFKMLLG